MYFEISAKNEDNLKKAFYSSIAELNFFDMDQDFNKEKIIKELEKENEGNKESNKNKDELFKEENQENRINIDFICFFRLTPSYFLKRLTLVRTNRKL